MKFLKYFILVIVFNFSVRINAQTDALEQDVKRGSTFRTFDLTSSELVGTIYIHHEFLPAKINTNKKLYFARYDAYHNEMEVREDDGIHYLPKIYNLTFLFIESNKVYQVFDYKISKTEQLTEFFVVLVSGKIKLLALEDVEYFEGVKAKSGYEKNKPAILERAKDKYYVVLNDNLATELPKKKKDFLSLFSNKSEKIESYMKENKLNNKAQEDLVKIFGFYDSL